MKQTINVLSISLLLSTTALAQFSVDRIYTDGLNSYNIAMQSANFDGDSIFVPFKQWYHPVQFQDCYYPDSLSVLGKEIRVSPEGVYKFVLAEFDTLRVHSNGALGESWIAWNSPIDDHLVEATVSDIGEETINGQGDMVSTITLQMLDGDFEEVDSPVNDMSFRFGEEYGMIQFPVLSSFPDFGYSIFNVGNVMRLEDDFNPFIDRDLGMLDVYNFQVGDILQIEEGESSFGELTIDLYSEEILSRTDYPDSIVYEIEIKSWFYNGLSSDFDPQPLDTVTETRTIKSDSLFDAPAGSALVEFSGFGDESFGTFSWLSQSEFGLSKAFVYNDPIFESPPTGEDCFSQMLDWGCSGGASEQYIENLGGPYFYCSFVDPFAEWRELVYYNTSSSGEWGEPLKVSDQRVDESSIEVYPNPVQGEFRIGNELNYSIQRVDVYDIQGRVLQSFSGNISAYDVSNLASGIYLAIVNFNNGKFGSKKIVIQ